MTLQTGVFAACCALVLAGCGRPEVDRQSELTQSISDRLTPVSTLPETLDPECNYGLPRMFDECGDQMDILEAGLARARAEGKIALVSYGAEFCTWCAVFDKHLGGEVGWFEYNNGLFPRKDVEKPHVEMVDEAIALNRFAADNFVVIHIEGQYAPGGEQVLEATHALDRFENEFPFIYVVNDEGRYLEKLPFTYLAYTRPTPRHRGIDRGKLLVELERMVKRSRPSEIRAVYDPDAPRDVQPASITPP